MTQQGGIYSSSTHSTNVSPSVKSGSLSQLKSLPQQSQSDVEKDEKNSQVQEHEDAQTSSTTRNKKDQADSQNFDHQWAIVSRPQENGGNDPPDRVGCSSHFDITLGWGDWKHTLFSWDPNVRKK
ncbi:hypothetical protein F4810DRAFT_709025 [Camillea tinctor]|nr:hypothetical protein F4810DRAFT_709025 [Camillea tinctor]